jgi:hypothetical protein
LRKGIFGTLAGCEQNVLGGEQNSMKKVENGFVQVIEKKWKMASPRFGGKWLRAGN